MAPGGALQLFVTQNVVLVKLPRFMPRAVRHSRALRRAREASEQHTER